MAEAVRLVVWDLDETFWKGTVTEGGITDYVQAHHDIVIELAKRGILSSICSKNDSATIMSILRGKGILDYFVFPSISWDPKGMRLAQMVETVQLRASTVMFIDDNPNNRAEAAAIVPGLQIEDETFIPRMMADPRFRGKDDIHLSRLKQYKLLEERKRDEEQTSGGNEDFLRGCDVKVYIEYDIESHIDRAVELINRTNQLNYTKRRLPEDAESARQMLRAQMKLFDRVVGLVRVADKYGDYGFVGFFMTGMMRRTIEDGAANTHLEHFCFSCRTLGMLIEQWVYDYLGRPELHVAGEVLTDLSVRRTVDWVRLVESLDDVAPQYAKVAPQIVLYGGCEANSIGVYLNAYTEKLDVYGNYVANGVFVSVNYAARLIDVCDRNPADFAAEGRILALPPHLETGDIFATAAPGALFVFNFALDAHGSLRLRHKVHDWTFVLSPDGFGANVLYRMPEHELERFLDPVETKFSTEERSHLLRISRHLRENYEEVDKPSDEELLEDMRQIIDRIPQGSKFIMIADHHELRPSTAMHQIRSLPWVARYKAVMSNLTAEYPYAAFVSFSDVLKSEDEMVGDNHYHRAVYLRLAQRIASVAETLQPRSDSALSKRRLARLSADRRAERSLGKEASTLVQAGFEHLLRRTITLDQALGYASGLASGRLSPAEFIRAISSSDEFKSKWIATDPVRHPPLRDDHVIEA